MSCLQPLSKIHGSSGTTCSWRLDYAHVTANASGSDVGDRTTNRNGLAWDFAMTPG
ncbi:MAG: hypothetical protein ABJM39_02360 [Porticoccus sp.]|uniref:hypothetical protein n=1 Tax=Porticoccus sp. TaxID=2024853 RepID=UPI0025E5DC3C|nr:hypothetical protein [Porticoccus sp.]